MGNDGQQYRHLRRIVSNLNFAPIRKQPGIRGQLHRQNANCCECLLVGSEMEVPLIPMTSDWRLPQNRVKCALATET